MKTVEKYFALSFIQHNPMLQRQRLNNLRHNNMHRDKLITATKLFTTFLNSHLKRFMML